VMRGLFVTGTDTGIGKTIVSAVLMNSLREREDVCYWKPVQTGIEEDNDTETVRELAGCTDDEIHDHGIRLKRPLSPHISAHLAGVEISVEQITKTTTEYFEKRFWIVEGAGGVHVPLNDDELMIDLIQTLGLPVVVVSRSGLGTINHTLLTLEALRNRSTDIAGVVMNGEPNLENKNAIENYGSVKVLAQIPVFGKLSSKSIRDVKIVI